MRPLVLAALAAALALPARAGDGAQITIDDAYARASNTMAGAAFMQITNMSESADRLIAVMSDAAERVELHTHLEDANGVMRMIEVEDGFAIPAGGTHALRRGGDHVMFMGLTEPFEQGETVAVTFVFERAGEVTLEIPVDLERTDGHGAATQGAATN